MCVANSIGFTGFRLNNSLYTAHDSEREILFAEGTPVHVMGIDEVLVDNQKKDAIEQDEFWYQFNGETITVVYLYHPGDV